MLPSVGAMIRQGAQGDFPHCLQRVFPGRLPESRKHVQQRGKGAGKPQSSGKAGQGYRWEKHATLRQVLGQQPYSWDMTSLGLPQKSWV